MKKIKYDLYDLIGDLLSKDGFYVDLINCNEFVIWYLLRQQNIRSYIPIIGTTCFIIQKSIDQISDILKDGERNHKIQLENAKRYFGIKQEIFTSKYASYYDFIVQAIEKNCFVFVLFDNLYNTLAYFKSERNSRHGHIIVGFNDDEKTYINLVKDNFKIKYNDLIKMIDHGYKVYQDYQKLIYYLYISKSKTNLNTISNAKDEMLNDIYISMECWDKEIEFFKTEIIKTKQAIYMSQDEKIMYAKVRNQFYNGLKNGFHGNFIFKLRLMKELFNKDFSELEEEYLMNRKATSVIANMYQKSIICFDKNEAYYDKTMQKICTKINSIYINEALIMKDYLLKQLQNI